MIAPCPYCKREIETDPRVARHMIDANHLRANARGEMVRAKTVCPMAGRPVDDLAVIRGMAPYTEAR